MWQDGAAMEHLKNILAGVGDVLMAFGTAPAYRYPQAGERSIDARRIQGDVAAVGGRLRNRADRELKGRRGKISVCEARNAT